MHVPLPRRFLFIVTSLVLYGTFSFAADQKEDYGWCEVTCPDAVKEGQAFTITVKVKDVAPGMKLGGDLHLNKENGGYGGYGKWGGNPKPVKPGDLVKLRYKMISKNNSVGAHVMLYLTKTDFKNAVKTQSSAVIGMGRAVAKKVQRPANATLKKSWISIGEPYNSTRKEKGMWVEGDKLILPVEYYVDPSDDWGGTKIFLIPAGPWVDCPDGKYTKTRSHQWYPGLHQTISCKVGKVITEKVEITIPKPYTERIKNGLSGDEFLFILNFKGADGKNWPWQVRRKGPTRFLGKDQRFWLDGSEPGNLFTYDQPVVINAIAGPRVEPEDKGGLSYSVYNVKNEKVSSGKVAYDPKKAGDKTPIKIDMKERGTFRVEVRLNGKETHHTTFARIPDLVAAVGNNQTRFGSQLIYGIPEAVKASRKLGLTTCRVWTQWSHIEPAKGVWRGFDELKRNLKDLRENNIRPWLLFGHPPAWAINNPETWRTAFEPFPFRDEDFTSVVNKLSTELKGDFIGYEWLNEIVQGKVSADPVADYVRLCKVGTTAAKEVDPSLITMLAGGLWPRTFRNQVLAAGVAEYIDVLPVHYSTYEGVKEALGDLKNIGATKVRVWDDETARGMSMWKMPLPEAMTNTAQSNYVLSRWPGEILAGAENIVYFGGNGEPAGNFSCFWGDMGPRPSAATIAVLVSKLYKSKPIGRFNVGKGAMIELFESTEGKPVMIVSSVEKDGEEIELQVGKGTLIATDYQGNETNVPVADGKVTVHAEKMRYILEGGDINILKAYVLPEITGASEVMPQFSMLKNGDNKIFLHFKNLYPKAVACTVRLDAPGRAGKLKPISLRLKPEESKTVPVSIDLSDTDSSLVNMAVDISFGDKKLPVVKKRFAVNVISPDMVGNLLKNGGFEIAGKDESYPAFWSPTRFCKRIAWKDNNELGHGKYVYCFADLSIKWANTSQKVSPLQGGKKYLYTAWIKADNLQTASNVSLISKNGKTKTLYAPHVFQTSPIQKDWDVFRKCLSTPEDLATIVCTPVANGKGTSWIDNLRLTIYEDSMFSAEASKASGKITIDGDLDDFNKKCPIPLLGKSQLRVINKKYKWSPQNLSAVAYLNWDSQNIYLGVEVIDNIHHDGQKEENAIKDDSLVIGIHPLNRCPGEDSKAFELVLSSTSPGGSGKHTIYRPDDRNGGLQSGSLAKDSSTYDISIKRKGDRTIYEVALPLSDLGGVSGTFGTKLGWSFVLNDNDGSGTGACILWGDGIYPNWSPERFGTVVFADE